jgi:hypothetical protein
MKYIDISTIRLLYIVVLILSGKVVAFDHVVVQVLETTSCRNAWKCCVHKIHGGMTIPRTLHKRELHATSCLFLHLIFSIREKRWHFLCSGLAISYEAIVNRNTSYQHDIGRVWDNCDGMWYMSLDQLLSSKIDKKLLLIGILRYFFTITHIYMCRLVSAYASLFFHMDHGRSLVAVVNLKASTCEGCVRFIPAIYLSPGLPRQSPNTSFVQSLLSLDGVARHLRI